MRIFSRKQWKKMTPLERAKYVLLHYKIHRPPKGRQFKRAAKAIIDYHEYEHLELFDDPSKLDD